MTSTLKAGLIIAAFWFMLICLGYTHHARQLAQWRAERNAITQHHAVEAIP